MLSYVEHDLEARLSIQLVMKMACEKTIYLLPEDVNSIRIIILDPKHIPSRNASTERLRSIDLIGNL